MRRLTSSKYKRVKKTIFLTMFIIIFLIISLRFTDEVSAINRSDYSTKANDTFHFKVDQSPVVPGVQKLGNGGGRVCPSPPCQDNGTGGGVSTPFSIFSTNDFQTTIFIDTIPPLTTGTVYGVTVEQLPTNSSEGTLLYDIPNQQSQSETNYFPYDSPVISTDWSGWKTALNNIINSIKSQSAVQQATLSITENSASVFATTLIIQLKPTQSQTTGTVLKQRVTYDKATGKRLFYYSETDILFNGANNKMITQISLSTESIGAPSSGFSNYILASILVFGIITAAGTYIYQSHKGTLNTDDLIQKSAIKEKIAMNDFKNKLLKNIDSVDEKKKSFSQSPTNISLNSRYKTTKKNNKPKSRTRRR